MTLLQDGGTIGWKAHTETPSLFDFMGNFESPSCPGLAGQIQCPILLGTPL